MSTRVLIVARQPIFRRGLRGCLDSFVSIDVVGEASDGPEALSLAADLRPDVIVAETGSSRPDAFELCHALESSENSCRVLLLTERIDRRTVVSSTRAGVSALVRKETDPDEILRAVTVVAAGEYYFPQEVLRVLVEVSKSHELDRNGHDLLAGAAAPGPAETGQASRANADLSAREEEVLALVANGLTSREIASELQISVRTVEAHRARISDKLRIRTVAGLVRYAVKKRLIAPAR